MFMKMQNSSFVAGMLAAILLFSIVTGAGAKSVNQAQDGLPKPPAPKRISAAELKNLRWIEGTWRGTGDVESPFFERYHFENDGTLVVESFSDGTLSKVDDVTRFELKDGQFGNSGEGARWVATQFDNSSITFEPVARARNTFRWQKVSDDVWKAVLNWPANGNNPAKQKIYRMERWPTPKQ